MIAETIISAATASLIKSVADKMITPKIKRFAKKCGISYMDLMIPKGEHFIKYLNQMYEKYSVINTLVFHNSQRELKEIYVPQTIVDVYCTDSNNKYTEIDKFPVELMKKYKKILITDTAGMGKSTIMKRMFIDIIDSGIKDIGIPIYIEMNRLNKRRSIIEEIREQLDYESMGFNNMQLLSFIQSGGFIFFLDGYDEIPLRDMSWVTANVNGFITKVSSGNYFVLASRPESLLKSFGNFQLFRIKPLEKNDAFRLLRNYDWSDSKELSQKLISLLQSEKYRTIDEYLENPLLVSLLYAAFDYKRVIPIKKHLFYRQVFDAFFDTHDLSKGIDAHQKRSGLDIDGFTKVLSYVGFMTLKSMTGVNFEKDKILKVLGDAKVFCGNLEFNEADFLEDLIVAVPLFSLDGTEYKWSHKSLMEYFAALFIANDAKHNQDAILSAINCSRNINHYLNMLDLYYDIDFSGFSKNFTLPLCQQFLDFRKEEMKNYNLDSIRIRKDFIEERIGLLFMCRIAYLWTQKNENQTLIVNKFQKQLSDNRKISDRYIYKGLKIWESFLFNRNPLYELLSQKQPSLFKIVRSYDSYEMSIKMVTEYITKKFKEMEVCDLTPSLGKEGIDLYRSLNTILKAKIIKRLYFNYESCMQEVERIKKNLTESMNIFDLTSGL